MSFQLTVVVHPTQETKIHAASVNSSMYSACSNSVLMMTVTVTNFEGFTRQF